MTLGIRILVILSMHRKQITQYVGGDLLAVHQPVFWMQKDNIKIENRVIGVELMYIMAGVGVASFHTETF